MSEKQSIAARNRPKVVEARIVVAKIRELAKVYKERGRINKIARMVGWERRRVWKVLQELSYADKSAATIESLGLRRLTLAKLCRRCGEPTTLFTSNSLCVECELNELCKHGVITIAKATNGEA